MIKQMKLERKTKNTIVRPYKKSDYQSWKKAYLSILPKAGNIWDITIPRKEENLTKVAFAKILKAQKQHRTEDYFYDFGIFLKNGNLIGGVSLMDISRQVFQNAYLGYRIFNNYWGKGYGKEAIKAAIEIAFIDLKLHRIEAGIEPRNKRSIRLAKSIGLRREGLSKKRLFLRGKWLDMALYVATSEDFGIQPKTYIQKVVLKRF